MKIMKRLILLFTIVFMASLSMPVMAQKDATKKSKKELQKKPIKMARKAAKKLKHKGYYVAPGALPLDKQLEKAYIKQYMDDEEGYPKYIVASGNGVAGTQTAARIQALETAKLELAGTIATNVAALVQADIANQQMTREDAATVTKIVSASKNIIAQELGRVIPLTEIYKNVGKENIECDVQLAYDSKTAKEVAKKVIREELEKQGEELQDKLDKMLNF
jgi:hypothetical protein